jgi:hypothetical protein
MAHCQAYRFIAAPLLLGLLAQDGSGHKSYESDWTSDGAMRVVSATNKSVDGSSAGGIALDLHVECCCL